MPMDPVLPVLPRPVQWDRDGPHRVERLRSRDHARPEAEPGRRPRRRSGDSDTDADGRTRKGRFVAFDA
jgi:hypothetical protein